MADSILMRKIMISNVRVILNLKDFEYYVSGITMCCKIVKEYLM